MTLTPPQITKLAEMLWNHQDILFDYPTSIMDIEQAITSFFAESQPPAEQDVYAVTVGQIVNLPDVGSVELVRKGRDLVLATAKPPAEVRPVEDMRPIVMGGKGEDTQVHPIKVGQPPPAPPVDVDAFMSIVERAWESGYIHGHNDEMDGCFDKDTNFQAKTNARNFKQCVTESTAALSAEVELLRKIRNPNGTAKTIMDLSESLELARKENGELKKLIKHAYIHSGYKDCGFLQMTTEQKLIFVDILESSDMKSCSETLRKNISKPSDAAKGRGV